MEYPISLLLMSWGGVIKCLYFIRMSGLWCKSPYGILNIVEGLYEILSFCWVIDDTMIFIGSLVNFFPIAVVLLVEVNVFLFFYPFN